MFSWLLLGLLSAAAALCRPARAVIFYSTAEAAFNTQAPTGTLADSGWQYQGVWSDYLGTPIAPSLFITAAHVGGDFGQVFQFRGVSYLTVAVYNHPTNDLRIWEVSGVFPSYAPLYDKNNELNKSLVVFGRGTQRGDTLTLNGQLKGWLYGQPDGALRWGENRVAQIPTQDGQEYLRASFDANAGANEAHLSTGDSGGAVFIQDSGVWKLAGINRGVDGPFNTSTSGAGFNAALVDAGGYYSGGEDRWTFVSDLPVNVPTSWYATRIFSSLAWIQEVVAAHGNSGCALRLQGSDRPEGPYTDEEAARIDAAGKVATLAAPSGGSPRFFRLKSCEARAIVSIFLVDGVIRITFE